MFPGRLAGRSLGLTLHVSGLGLGYHQYRQYLTHRHRSRTFVITIAWVVVYLLKQIAIPDAQQVGELAIC